MLKNMKLSVRIVLGIMIVEFISLASGITMGQNITSKWVIVGFIATVVISQIIAWLVTENVKVSVKSVLSDLSDSSNSLESLSKNLNTSSCKLSESEVAYAASIQETSATLEESSSMIHQTTQNTKEADKLAMQTKGSSDEGNQKMQVMLDAMNELKTSSGEISKIIKVIDEIAFQTNILSLNAAVEAARAGDAGKGFAVVAEEVRDLAQRSAEAAEDTADIIENNIKLSEKCVTISEQVGSVLADINTESNKVTELLAEISTASQEQEIGIGQITKAVSQMEIALQSSSTNARDCADYANNLIYQSEELKKIKGCLEFLINGNNSHADAKKVNLGIKVPQRKETKDLINSKRENNIRIQNVNKSSVSVDKKIDNKSLALSAAAKVSTVKVAEKVRPEDIIPLDDF